MRRSGGAGQTERAPVEARALMLLFSIYSKRKNQKHERSDYELREYDARRPCAIDRCGRAAHRARPRASDAPRAGHRPGGCAVGSSRSTAIILRDTVRRHTITSANPRTREGSYTTRQRNRPSAASKRRRSSRFRACAVLHSLPGAPHDGVPRSWLMRSHRPRRHSR